jgi:molybdate transport system substrate-binding protein
LTVFAAASLTAAFQQVGSAFEKANPGVTIDFNFGGSSTLVSQIQQGADADLFASADEANMAKLERAGMLAGSPETFVTNRLEIVVAPGNPKRIATLSDLQKPGLLVVLCGSSVPCGNYARQALAKAGVHLTPVSEETDVKGVISKVSLGEADAGIVYVTDVKAAGANVGGVAIPANQNVPARYPAAVLKQSSNQAGAKAFLAYLKSGAAQTIFRRLGFGGA